MTPYLVIVGMVLTGGSETQDCVIYEPAKLKTEMRGDSWALLADARLLVALSGPKDAAKMLAVARRHTGFCRIGGAGEVREVTQYWTGDSGITTIVPGVEDCIAYEQKDLWVDHPSENRWRIRASSKILMVASSEAHGQQALNLARAHRLQCFVGRDNRRPAALRRKYVFQYWK